MNSIEPLHAALALLGTVILFVAVMMFTVAMATRAGDAPREPKVK